MTREEAIAKARDVAAAEGWPWSEPVEAFRQRAFMIDGPLRWHVRSHRDAHGRNVFVLIDDRTREVRSKKLFAGGT